MVKNLPAMLETQVWLWVGKIPWRREWQRTPVFLPGKFHAQSMGSHIVGQEELLTLQYTTCKGFPGDSSGKESTCQCRRHKRCLGSIPGPGRSPGVGKWHPTPVFLPGKFHGQRSLACYSPWSHRESATTEWLSTAICKLDCVLFPRCEVIFHNLMPWWVLFSLCGFWKRGEECHYLLFLLMSFLLSPHPRLFWQNFFFICVPGAPVVDTAIKQYYFILRVIFFFCLLCWSVNPLRLLGKELFL